MHMWPCPCPRMGPGRDVQICSGQQAVDGALQGLCCRAGLMVPSLCLVLVPGTVGL